MEPVAWCGNVCPGRGQCPRFGVRMAANWTKLCRTREDYRKLLLEGRGPGQPVSPDAAGPKDAARRRPVVPPLHERAWTLTKAVGAFIADGCRTVSKEEYERRLSLCLAPEGDGEHCANLIDEKICGLIGATGCGCYVAAKAAGRVWTCPRGKWERKQGEGIGDQGSGQTLLPGH